MDVLMTRQWPVRCMQRITRYNCNGVWIGLHDDDSEIGSLQWDIHIMCASMVFSVSTDCLYSSGFSFPWAFPSIFSRLSVGGDVTVEVRTHELHLLDHSDSRTSAVHLQTSLYIRECQHEMTWQLHVDVHTENYSPLTSSCLLLQQESWLFLDQNLVFDSLEGIKSGNFSSI